jgi:hypothetical protein
MIEAMVASEQADIDSGAGSFKSGYEARDEFGS